MVTRHFLLSAIGLFALLAFVLPARAEPTPLEKRAKEVCAHLKADPAGLEALFNEGFMAKVGKDRLLGITRATVAQTGDCTSSAVTKASSPTSGELAFTMSKGLLVPATMSVEEKAPHLIAGLFLRPPVAQVKSLDDVVAKVKALPGVTSLLVLPLDGGKPLAALDAEKPLAVGSAFKLYILAELGRQIEAGKRTASDTVILRDEQRSFSSAFLEKWPKDAPLTLHTVATMMISKSDNTATDLLLATLGPETVEAGLGASGHEHPEGMRPFLSTVQAFRLKLLADPATRARWSKASVAERRKILSSMTQPLSDVKKEPRDAPLAIETIEWFASTGDLCRVMRVLRGQGSMRDILAVNPGIPVDNGRWPFVGFKGGSETGVINLTFLLEDKAGKATCVAATWNDPAKAVDNEAFVALVGALIQNLP